MPGGSDGSTFEAVYVREQAISDVERVVEAMAEVTARAKAMVDQGDYTDEEARAFLGAP